MTLTDRPTLHHLQTLWQAMQAELPEERALWTCDWSPTSMVEILQAMRGGDLLLVALENDEAIGVCWVSEMAHDAYGVPVHGWIDFYVVPGRRGKVALDIAKRCDKWLRKQMGLRQWYMLCDPANKKSHVFIERWLKYYRIGILPRFACHTNQGKQELRDMLLYSKYPPINQASALKMLAED